DRGSRLERAPTAGGPPASRWILRSGRISVCCKGDRDRRERDEQKELEMHDATVASKAILVTGANRGIGQALVEEALRRGAARVYAGARRPFIHRDRRVTPLILDVTDAAQIEAAADRVEAL